jgi:hypothetical protein
MCGRTLKISVGDRLISEGRDRVGYLELEVAFRTGDIYLRVTGM